MSYDVEMLLDDIEVLLKAKLPAKLIAIEAEKTALGIPVGLDAIDPTAYFQQNWSDEILNQAPAIFYGVESIQAESIGPATIEKLKLFVEIIMLDSGMDAYGKRRLNRYSRAIKEVFHENFDQLPWSNKTIVETVRPISFTLDENTSEEMRVGGVSIATAIA